MIVTAFGDLKFGDTGALWEWLCAHDIKHQSLADALINVTKTGGPSFLLADTIDDQWAEQHWLTHVNLANAFAPSSTSAVQELATNPMSDAGTFYDWMQWHDQIHQALDQALGVDGS